MIKNIFYSLFLHFFIIILVYFSFQSNPPIEIDKNLTVAISFEAKTGNNSDAVNSNVVNPQKIISKNKPKPQTILSKKTNKKPSLKPKVKEIKNLTKKNQPKAKIKQENQEVISNPENQILKKEDKQEQEKPKIKEEKFKEEDEDIEIIDKEMEDEELEEEDEDNKNDQFEFTENSIENLDLLVREKSNIQSQIKRCYKKALEEDGENQIAIDVHILIDKQGSIDVDLVKFKSFEQYKELQQKDFLKLNKADFNKSIETVKKALRFCSPIRNLPQDKYNIWKEIDLKFD